ncbi:MAG: M6 family metalloprotease domain-containing protein [Bacteroidaceae bacterium]|nr:M6 family metalloprotease domain-containing protein [Bacteroidaceae bacterium]
MKRLILSLLFIGIILSAQAQGFERLPRTAKQIAGSTVNLYNEGNAQTVFYSTEDGYAVLREEDGGYYYALSSSKGLTASAQLAHNPSERDASERDYVASQAITRQQAYTAASATTHRSPLKASARTTYGLGEYGKPANGVVSSIGAINIPVIMVEFPDREFQSYSTIEKVSRYLNEEGYHDEANTAGSVRDYFLAQSANLFQPTFTVVAKVKVANNYAHYGSNSSSKRDVNLSALIKEAIDLSVSQGVDYSSMLVNGRVPLVTILFAGPGEHNAFEDGAEDYIWAQFSTLSYTSSLGGPTFSSFFVGDEIMQSYSRTKEGNNYVYNVTNTTFEGMGVFCHEFGHALGLPDFYNTSSGAGVVDYWSVMDYGQYYLNGYRPIGYSAYERNYMGWLQINDLEDLQETLQIYPLGSDEHRDKQAYRIVNPASANEYFILENRQAGTWYPEVLGTGLLIYHIDYLASAWSGNSLNRTASHPRFQVFPADGQNQVYTTLRNNGLSAADAYAAFAGDLFPGTTASTTIASFPTSTGSAINTPIYNIAQLADQTITLQYLDLPQPTGTFVTLHNPATNRYVGTPTSTGTPLVSDASEAGIYYVTADNQLVSFQNGQFIKEQGTAYTVEEIGQTGEVATFAVSAKTVDATAGTYSIKTATGYMQAGDDALTVHTTGDDATCEFVLQEVNQLPITIQPASQFATLNLPVAFNAPNDATVYYVNRLHDNLLSLSECTLPQIAAGVPVMLYKEGGGQISITLSNEAGETISDNLLQATTLGGTLVPATDKAYIFALNDEGTTALFRLLNDTDRGVSGFKAYFVSDDDANTPQFLYFDNGLLTGISAIATSDEQPVRLYDLQGRRVDAQTALPAGIYILKSGNSSKKITIR